MCVCVCVCQVVIVYCDKVYQGGSGLCVLTDFDQRDGARRIYCKALCLCPCVRRHWHISDASVFLRVHVCRFFACTYFTSKGLQ